MNEHEEKLLSGHFVLMLCDYTVMGSSTLYIIGDTLYNNLLYLLQCVRVDHCL